MPVYWNFRAVLDIDKKNRSCVGTKKGKNVGRCSNIVHHRDLKAAGHLLDQMDQSKSFKGSIDRLETLAGLLLCKGVHNNHKTKARLSQVDEVTEKWTIIVEEKYRIIERQREKELLLRMSESARQIKAELEEERADKILHKSSKNDKSKSQNSDRTAGLEDPFGPVVASVKSTNIIFTPAKKNSIEASRASNAKAKAKVFVKVVETEVESSEATVLPKSNINKASKASIPITKSGGKVEETPIGTSQPGPLFESNIGLPTPDTTPQNSKSSGIQHFDQVNTLEVTPAKPQKTPARTNQPLTPPSSIKSTKHTTEFTFEYEPTLKAKTGFKSKLESVKAITEQTWSFPVFSDIEQRSESYASTINPQKQLTFSTTETSTTIRAPLKKKGTSTHNNMKARLSKQSDFEFGNQDNMPFKNFSFKADTPYSFTASAKAKKDAPKLAPHSPERLFKFDLPVEETPTTVDQKDAQPLPETQPITMFQSNLGRRASSSQILSKMISDDNTIPTSNDFEIPPRLFTDNASEISTVATISTTIIEPRTSNDSPAPSSIPNQNPPATDHDQTTSQDPTIDLNSSPTIPNPDLSPIFGTAVITPSATHKIHLPTRRSQLLSMSFNAPSSPPQEQAPNPKARTASTEEDRYVLDLQIWDRIEKQDKNLPSLPWEPARREGSGEWKGNGGQGVVMDGGVVEVEGLGGEDQDDVGCLGGLSRLRKKVMGKLRWRGREGVDKVGFWGAF